MKKIFTLLTALCLISTIKAQTTYRLYVEHKLGTSPFALNQSTTNNLGGDFKVERLQYYMSNFAIIHDGGQTLKIDTLYVLMNAANAGEIMLGQYSGIDTVEAIQFSIGVNAPVNNQDPSQWPGNHALAPKSPSMHWGWSAGYRFVALEGKAGASMSQGFELHALGNNHYHTIQIPVQSSEVFGEQHMIINADYTRALEDIDISNGLILHGEGPETNKMLLNFKQYVFSNSNGEGNIYASVQRIAESEWNIFPNPSNGQVNVDLSGLNLKIDKLIIRDITGREIAQQNVNDEAVCELNFTGKGVYFISIQSAEGLTSTRKLIIH